MAMDPDNDLERKRNTEKKCAVYRPTDRLYDNHIQAAQRDNNCDAVPDH